MIDIATIVHTQDTIESQDTSNVDVNLNTSPNTNITKLSINTVRANLITCFFCIMREEII